MLTILKSGFKFVANFAEGVDKSWIVRVWLDLVSQCSYTSVDTALCNKIIVTPNGIQYFITSQSLALSFQEEFKKLKFFWGKFDFLAVFR